MDRKKELLVSHVKERDIDLLLLEELYASSQFGYLFANLLMHKAGFPGKPKSGSLKVLQSVKRPGKTQGETDLFVGFGIDYEGPQSAAFLIENKIDAEFMPRQPERYQEEASRLRKEYGLQNVGTALIAPWEYLSQSQDSAIFDTFISYEEVKNLFQEAGEKGSDFNPDRLAYKVALLDQAIQRNRRGYEPETHEGMTSFLASYYQLAEAVAPSLKMAPPGNKAVDGHFIYFKGALNFSEFFQKGKIIHKTRQNRLDIQLDGLGNAMEGKEEAIAALLPPDMAAQKTGKSLAVGGTVPSVDPQHGFGDQVSNIQACLEYALRLQNWLQTHESELQAILLNEE